MEKDLETISPQLTLDTFARSILDGTVGAGPARPPRRRGRRDRRAAQVRAVPQRNWPSTRTEDVMVGGETMPSASPEDTPDRRPRTAAPMSHLDGLPVLDGTVLRGMLTRRSIAVAAPRPGRGAGPGPVTASRSPTGSSASRRHGSAVLAAIAGPDRRRARLPVGGARPDPRRGRDEPHGAAAVGQLGDGRLRDPGRRRGRRDRDVARSASRSSARSARASRRRPPSSAGRRSGSRPARRSRRGPTPWSRSS